MEKVEIDSNGMERSQSEALLITEEGLSAETLKAPIKMLVRRVMDGRLVAGEAIAILEQVEKSAKQARRVLEASIADDESN